MGHEENSAKAFDSYLDSVPLNRLQLVSQP